MPAPQTSAVVKMLDLDKGEVESIYRKVIHKLDAIIEIADSSDYQDLPFTLLDVRLYEFRPYFQVLGENDKLWTWMTRAASLTEAAGKSEDNYYTHGSMFLRIDYETGVGPFGGTHVREYGNSINVSKSMSNVCVSSIENPLLHCLLNFKMCIELMESKSIDEDFMVNGESVNPEDREDDEKELKITEVELGPGVKADEKTFAIVCCWGYESDAVYGDLIGNDKRVYNFFTEQKREVTFHPVAYIPENIKTYFVHADGSLQVTNIKNRMMRTTSLETQYGEVTMFNPRFRYVYSVMIVK